MLTFAERFAISLPFAVGLIASIGLVYLRRDQRFRTVVLTFASTIGLIALLEQIGVLAQNMKWSGDYSIMSQPLAIALLLAAILLSGGATAALLAARGSPSPRLRSSAVRIGVAGLSFLGATAFLLALLIPIGARLPGFWHTNHGFDDYGSGPIIRTFSSHYFKAPFVASVAVAFGAVALAVLLCFRRSISADLVCGVAAAFALTATVYALISLRLPLASWTPGTLLTLLAAASLLGATAVTFRAAFRGSPAIEGEAVELSM
jgi:hypothetical protein